MPCAARSIARRVGASYEASNMIAGFVYSWFATSSPRVPRPGPLPAPRPPARACWRSNGRMSR
ncbi:Uncharacterised protein [Mycobacteroides abscessus]|nr:Uncharacterised protein [Mycobacteroides abscessus]